MTTRQFKKFALLTSLYIAQGLPYGFFTQALPALLREQGVGLEAIGLASMLTLPWATKWLYAPLLDKWHNYRSWIIFTNLVAIAICLILAKFDLKQLVQHKLWLLYAGFFMLNLSSATQDIATDALAVLQLDDAERGYGNAIQVAGYRVGMVISGGALLAWFNSLGWHCSVLILALLLTLASFPIIVWRPELPPQIARSSGEFYRGAHAFQLLWSKDTRRWLVVLCLYKSGEYMAMPMLRPMLVDQHHTIEELAYLIGTVGFGAGLLGALVGGYFVKLFGHGAALRWFLIGNSISLLAYAEIAAFPLQSRWLLLACAIEHFSGGMATVALFTEMMYHCRANCEATDYTLQSCLTIVVSVSMASLSGFIAKAVGYPALFLLCSIWTLAIFPLVLWYQRRRDQMETQAQVRRWL